MASEAPSAAAGAPAAADQFEALFEGLNFAEIDGQFFSGPELLGALGTQGNAMLRDFLGRLKKSDARVKAYMEKKNDPEGGTASAPLHGGPAREPFNGGVKPFSGGVKPAHDRGSDAIEKMRQEMHEIVDFQRTLAEEHYVASIVGGVTKSVSELIKGQ
jgi:hypothetical protein